MPKFIIALICFIAILPFIMPAKEKPINQKTTVLEGQANKAKKTKLNYGVDSIKDTASEAAIEKPFRSNPITIENLESITSDEIKLSTAESIVHDLHKYKPEAKTDFQTDADYDLIRLDSFKSAGLYGDNIYYFIQNTISPKNFNSGLVKYDPEDKKFISDIKRNVLVGYAYQHRDKKEDYYINFDNLKRPTQIFFDAAPEKAKEISGFLSIVYVVKVTRYYYAADGRYMDRGFYLKSDLAKVLFIETDHDYDTANNKALPNYSILKSIDINKVNAQ